MVETDRLPVAPKYLCPFLGTRFDAATYSAINNQPNYCHKASPATPVAVEHQVLTCTTGEFQNCLVYSGTRPIRLPAEWSGSGAWNQEQKEDWWKRVWQVLAFSGIGLAILILAGLISQSWLHNLSVASGKPTGDFPIASATPQAQVATLTPSGTLTLFLTDTATSTARPNEALTQQVVIQTQTASTLAEQQTQTAFIPPENQTLTAIADGAGCTAQIMDPVYSPIKRDPPTIITYGNRPFLIKWKVSNTSGLSKLKCESGTELAS